MRCIIAIPHPIPTSQQALMQPCPQELLNDAFSLVESSGGHEADYLNAPMFDYEYPHVEAEVAWDAELEHVQAELTGAQQQVVCRSWWHVRASTPGQRRGYHAVQVLNLHG